MSGSMNSKTRRVVPCRVNGDIYLFAANDVCGIEQAVDCRDSAADESGLVGETEFDGSTIPVIGLGEALGYQSNGQTQGPSDGREHLVIVQTESGPVGVLADHVYGTQPNAGLIEMPKAMGNAPFRGIATFDRVQAAASRNETQDWVELSAALLVCPNRLVGFPPSAKYDFDRPGELAVFPAAKRKGQLILFQVPHRLLDRQLASVGLSATQVLEVLQITDLIPVPKAPAGVYGLLPWRDNFVPVIDLTAQLGLESIPDAARHRIAVARSQTGQLVAFYSSNDIRSVRLPFETAKYEVKEIDESPRILGSYASLEGLILFPSLDRCAATEVDTEFAAAF